MKWKHWQQSILLEPDHSQCRKLRKYSSLELSKKRSTVIISCHLKRKWKHRFLQPPQGTRPESPEIYWIPLCKNKAYLQPRCTLQIGFILLNTTRMERRFTENSVLILWPPVCPDTQCEAASFRRIKICTGTKTTWSDTNPRHKHGSWRGSADFCQSNYPATIQRCHTVWYLDTNTEQKEHKDLYLPLKHVC